MFGHLEIYRIEVTEATHQPELSVFRINFSQNFGSMFLT